MLLVFVVVMVLGALLIAVLGRKRSNQGVVKVRGNNNVSNAGTGASTAGGKNTGNIDVEGDGNKTNAGTE